MNPINLSERLMNPLRQVATEQGSSIDALVDEIVTNYLREKRHEKLVAEMQVFQEQHEKLGSQYAGQFIGMFQGKVLDYDTDGGVLHKRLHKRFGDIPILIVQVKDAPEQEFLRLHRRVLA